MGTASEKIGSYVAGALTVGEHVAYQGRVSLWSLCGSFILAAFLFYIGLPILIFAGDAQYQFSSLTFVGVAFTAAGCIVLGKALIRYFTTELAITNKRLFAKFGFISRDTIELNINKVESIQVSQGILGRIFNYGTLVVSGAGTPQAPVPGISKPLEFRRAFLEVQESLSKGA